MVKKIRLTKVELKWIENRNIIRFYQWWYYLDDDDQHVSTFGAAPVDLIAQTERYGTIGLGYIDGILGPDWRR